MFEFGEQDETPYIVMELVEGSTLRAVLDEGAPLPPERAFSIVQSVLDALATSGIVSPGSSTALGLPPVPWDSETYRWPTRLR